MFCLFNFPNLMSSLCRCPLLGAALEQHTRKVAVVELEVSLVVELEEGGAVGVVLLQVQVVDLGLWRRVPAVLTHVHLRASLFVVILVRHPVHLQAVALQGAALGEGFLTKIAFVRSDTCVSSCVSLQVESVVESLAAEGAEVSLDVAVALHVSVQKSL